MLLSQSFDGRVLSQHPERGKQEGSGQHGQTGECVDVCVDTHVFVCACMCIFHDSNPFSHTVNNRTSADLCRPRRVYMSRFR